MPEKENEWKKYFVLLIPVVVAAVFLLSGCVKQKPVDPDDIGIVVQKAFDLGQEAGRAEKCGLVEEERNALSAELAAAKERLAKFNQVDAAGNLRALKNELDGYEIQKGDTLWDLSQKFLGDPFLWPTLWELNQDTIVSGDPDRIEIGEWLVLEK